MKNEFQIKQDIFDGLMKWRKCTFNEKEEDRYM